MNDIQLQVTNDKLTDLEAQILEDNIKFYCNTPRGSLVQNRSYGLDFSIFDEPFAILRMKATVDIVSGIQREYGVHINTIDIQPADDSGVIIKISV